MREKCFRRVRKMLSWRKKRLATKKIRNEGPSLVNEISSIEQDNRSWKCVSMPIKTGNIEVDCRVVKKVYSLISRFQNWYDERVKSVGNPIDKSWSDRYPSSVCLFAMKNKLENLNRQENEGVFLSDGTVSGDFKDLSSLLFNQIASTRYDY